MKPLTVVIPYSPGPLFEKALLCFAKSELVESVVIISQGQVHLNIPRCRILIAGPLPSQETLRLILDGIRTKYLLLLPGPEPVSLEEDGLEQILTVAESMEAGLLYSDFYDVIDRGKTLHPLNDYQPGSVRDGFDFGDVILLSVAAIRQTLEKHGLLPGLKFAGLYDLRLKVSIDHPIYHLKEPLYTVIAEAGTSRTVSAGLQELPPQEKLFNYVDPRNEAVQKEMEHVFTGYLKKIGAYLPSHQLREVKRLPGSFAAEASVVIPVRNRKGTITEAVKSALSQEADFPFNVIVVDNHSTDGTTAVLADLAGNYPALKHAVPKVTNLGIGGCWNEALRHEACGRYAVQLDSDDLYSSSHTLQRMIDRFRHGNYAMVIGSYTLVDSRLDEIPPGLVNHREWTDQNGHNNALRINGLGAPRAFNSGLMRTIGFLNVSYGEDYAAALRVSREYRIGRIYESLYLCRRWSGNTDASLTIEESNRNDAFKDRIRTEEILARQKIVREKLE